MERCGERAKPPAEGRGLASREVGYGAVVIVVVNVLV
ncbi:MAG: hypothetical protein QOF51_3495 [Chloroflexota bacterium]|jgi:hypothetical protein|nr:hypothetical protein [Chloroflexota bacterium]